ncbi:MAG: helix-hairpin-helix domain-containing protein [Thermoanaerobaculia bacterium]|nr:helix-hairpin-helix domain-containing protein [Thermoanaerobaculia bacterium]
MNIINHETDRARKSLRLALGGLLLAIVSLTTVTPAVAAGAATPSGVVNVNQASVDQLTLLPRIGPAVAARIVEHREANGPFAGKEELMLVRGIGERTYENLEPFITLEGKTTLSEKVRLPKPASSGSD